MKSRLILAAGAACLFAVAGPAHSQGLEQNAQPSMQPVAQPAMQQNAEVLRSRAPTPRTAAFPPLAAQREVCVRSPAYRDLNATSSSVSEYKSMAEGASSRLIVRPALLATPLHPPL